MRFLFCGLIALFFATLSLAQKPVTYCPPYFADTARLQKIKAILPLIDKIYTDYATKNHFPSIAYGIVVDGQLIHTNYTGLINIETNSKADKQAVYRIASMTKSFTAMAILKLRDEGKL
jgi:CubicO group peptidase (beta-lactamase class C family)